MERVTRIAAQARRLGFDRIGVAPAHPPQSHLQAYRNWLDRGDHGEMAYMARPDRVARREDPTLILPNARTAICVAVNYYPGPATQHPGVILPGRVSNYAWGQDYHDWMLPRLEELASWIRAEIDSSMNHRAYADTGPLLERALAAQAGLGFIGQNTCLIHPQLGSWLFLGEILIDIDLPTTPNPLSGRCGTCTRCLDACPTGALSAPYRLDGRRCISYLTIEFKGILPPDLRPLMGNWIYGCDICQAVCPWQRFAHPTPVGAFQATSPDRSTPSLLEWVAMDEIAFQNRFAATPLLRTGRARLLRNVAVALGNSGDRQAVPVLRAALADAEPLIRGHAAWALGRIGGTESARTLETAQAKEADPAVRQELDSALKEIRS